MTAIKTERRTLRTNTQNVLIKGNVIASAAIAGVFLVIVVRRAREQSVPTYQTYSAMATVPAEVPENLPLVTMTTVTSCGTPILPWDATATKGIMALHVSRKGASMVTILYTMI
jgi:hypothetical protein